MRRLHPLLTLLLITQTRLRNIPLFLLSTLQARLVRMIFLETVPTTDASMVRPSNSRSPTSTPRSAPNTTTSAIFKANGIPTSTTALSLTILLLSYVSFFASGGTNSISSLDLSQAYNGMLDYSPVTVALRLILGNWAGPIWWTWYGWTLLYQHADSRPGGLLASESRKDRNGYDATNVDSTNGTSVDVKPRCLDVRDSTTGDSMTASRKRETYKEHIALCTLFMSIATTSTLVACTILRTHLFVWTVFSPKFLYLVAWLLVWHLSFGVGLGALALCVD